MIAGTSVAVPISMSEPRRLSPSPRDSPILNQDISNEMKDVSYNFDDLNDYEEAYPSHIGNFVLAQYHSSIGGESEKNSPPSTRLTKEDLKFVRELNVFPQGGRAVRVTVPTREDDETHM